MEDYKARAEAVRQAEVFEGAFAISVCPAENVESPTVVGAQAANELLDIIGIKASVVLTPYNGKIYVSARSIDEMCIRDRYSPEKDVTYVRGFLGRMLFAGEDGVKKVKVLSGGERVRCMLSKMMISGANVLMFDEPTDHLDMRCV